MILPKLNVLVLMPFILPPHESLNDVCLILLQIYYG